MPKHTSGTAIPGRADIPYPVRDDGGSWPEHRLEFRSCAWGPATTVIGSSVAGVLAVGIALSAILVVSREQVSPTGAIIPSPTSVPTTTAEPSTASPETPNAPHAAPRAPAYTPPAPIEPTAAPSAPPPESPPTTHSITPRRPQTTVRPTTHRPFPLESTDFPGPYDTPTR